MKFFLQSQIILVAIAFACVSQATEVNSILAPSSQNKNINKTLNKSVNKEFVRPKLPEGTPPGGRRTGGGRRDSCPYITPQLTALVPVTEEPATVQNVWGLTTEERPTFWYYLPYTKSLGYPASFVLQNSKSNLVYKKEITLPEQPGIIGIKIPANIPALELNKQYRWFLKVHCDQQKKALPVYVEGVVSRVNLPFSIKQQLQSARPLQKFAIYAQNGIWHQALSTLIELKQQNPQDNTIEADWKNLLSQVGLDEIAEMQIVNLDSNNYDRLSKQH